MIDLNDKDLIADSGTRECYLHPEDSGKVIKIVLEKTRRKRDANWQEWRHYHYIKKRHGRLNCISACHGFVDTNRGKGLVLDCVRDNNGEISGALMKILNHPASYNLIAVETALDGFCRLIIEKNIQLFDLNLTNILIRVQADGFYQPVSVDLKGRYNNYEFIPVSTYIPFFSRRKLTRRCSRLMERLRHVTRKLK